MLILHSSQQPSKNFKEEIQKLSTLELLDKMTQILEKNFPDHYEQLYNAHAPKKILDEFETSHGNAVDINDTIKERFKTFKNTTS